MPLHKPADFSTREPYGKLSTMKLKIKINDILSRQDIHLFPL